MSAQSIPQIGMPDFGALPPEVNSGLIYAGAGSGPLVSAAAAWADLASELVSAADGCAAVLSELAGNDWQGPAATSMVAAAAPYTGWMRATAGYAAHAASQASTAVGAYETAFAAAVPPPVIAENRVRLAALVTTNLLGQNTAAIAATEAAYAEMWAQDATTMYRYAGDSAAAATLNPLSEPPATTTAGGTAGQAAASAHAAATAAASAPTTLAQQLSNALQALGLNIANPGSGTSTTGLGGLLNLLSGSSDATPFSNFLNSTLVNSAIAGAPYSPAFIGQVVGEMSALMTVLGRTLTPAAAVSGLSSAASPLGSVAPTSTGLGGLGTLTGSTSAGQGAITASVGNASLVRSLSVPHNWTVMAAPAETVTAPATALPAAAPTASPVITAGIPSAAASSASRMVDKPEDEDEEAPVYGFPTKALRRTPVGG